MSQSNTSTPLNSENKRAEFSDESVLTSWNENYRITYKGSETLPEKFLLVAGGLITSHIGIIFPESFSGITNLTVNGVEYEENRNTEGHYIVSTTTLADMQYVMEIPEWFTSISVEPLGMFVIILPADTPPQNLILRFEHDGGSFSENIEYSPSSLIFDTESLRSGGIPVPEGHVGPFLAVPEDGNISIYTLGAGVVSSVLVNDSETEFSHGPRVANSGQLMRYINISEDLVSNGDLVKVTYSLGEETFTYEHPINIFSG